MSGEAKRKRKRGRPPKIIPAIPGPFESIIKALVQPVRKEGV